VKPRPRVDLTSLACSFSPRSWVGSLVKNGRSSSAVCPLVTRVGGRRSACAGRRQALHSPEEADPRRPPRPFTIVLRGGSGGLCGEDFIPTDQLLSAGSNWETNI